MLLTYHLGLLVDLTSGVIPSRNKFLFLLKLTILKITLWKITKQNHLHFT